MKYYDFVLECNKRYIDPSLALENDSILQIMATTKDRNEIIRILDTEFQDQNSEIVKASTEYLTKTVGYPNCP